MVLSRRTIYLIPLVMLLAPFQNCSRFATTLSSLKTQNSLGNARPFSVSNSPRVLVVNLDRSANPMGGDDVTPINGRLTAVDEIANTLCPSSKCPTGGLRLGISAPFMPFEETRPQMQARLDALIASAKQHHLYFMIHTCFEWIFDRNVNPFGVPESQWAEYSNWNQPIGTYYLNWGTLVAIGKKPNFWSEAYRARVKQDVQYLSAQIHDKIFADPEALSLFLGVDMAWETEVTPSANGERIGYAALAHKGFGPNNPPMDFDVALGDVAQDHVGYMTQLFDAGGVPRSLLYNHTVFAKNRTPAEIKRAPQTVAQLLGINLGVSSFGGGFAAGQIAAKLSRGWSVTETDPGSVASVINGLAGDGLQLGPPNLVVVYSWGANMRGNASFAQLAQGLFNTQSSFDPVQPDTVVNVTPPPATLPPPPATTTTPQTAVGLFRTPDGGIYSGFKDFYCHYPTVDSLNRIYGSSWSGLLQNVGGLPKAMTNAGDCGPNQGIHRSGSSFFYTYKANFTCWIASVVVLQNWAGLAGNSGLQLPDSNMQALGLNGQTTAATICQ